MSASMISSTGDGQRGYVWFCCWLGVLVCDRSVLEAVGRKDLPIAAHRGRRAAAGTGRESAPSANHPAAARSLLAPCAAQHTPTLSANPSAVLPSSPCDHRSPLAPPAH